MLAITYQLFEGFNH